MRKKTKLGSLAQYYPVILYFLIAFIALHKLILADGTIAMQVDWSTPLYSGQYWYWLLGEAHAWSELLELGNSSGSSGVYGKFIFWLFSLIFSDGFVMKMVVFSIFTISGIAAYMLGVSVNISRFSSFIVGVVYMSTPYIFDRTASGLVFMSLSYAILPILIINLLLMYQEMSLKRSILTGFIAGLVITNAANIIILPVLIILLSMFLYYQYGLSFFKALLLMIIVIAISIAMHLHWLIPIISNLFDEKLNTLISSTLSGTPVRFHVSSYDLIDSLRLDTFHVSFFRDLSSSILWHLFSYTYLLMVIYVVRKPYNNYTYTFVAMYLIGAILPTLSSGLTGTFYFYLLDNITILSVLRDMGKFSLISSIFLSVIVGIFIDCVRKEIRSKHYTIYHHVDFY